MQAIYHVLLWKIKCTSYLPLYLSANITGLLNVDLNIFFSKEWDYSLKASNNWNDWNQSEILTVNSYVSRNGTFIFKSLIILDYTLCVFVYLYRFQGYVISSLTLISLASNTLIVSLVSICCVGNAHTNFISWLLKNYLLCLLYL